MHGSVHCNYNMGLVYTVTSTLPKCTFEILT